MQQGWLYHHQISQTGYRGIRQSHPVTSKSIRCLYGIFQFRQRGFQSQCLEHNIAERCVKSWCLYLRSTICNAGYFQLANRPVLLDIYNATLFICQAAIGFQMSAGSTVGHMDVHMDLHTFIYFTCVYEMLMKVAKSL